MVMECETGCSGRHCHGKKGGGGGGWVGGFSMVNIVHKSEFRVNYTER